MQCSTYDECVAKTSLAFCKICSNNETREKWQEANKFGRTLKLCSIMLDIQCMVS